MTEHGFLLHKGEFRDALCLRCGWNHRNTPISCNCGTPFSVDHAMTCHMGGIPTIRHNEIRDIAATLLTDICHNVATEALLLKFSHPSFSQQRVEWAVKRQHSTRDWQTEFPGRSERNIRSSWGGFTVVSLLQSSAQPFYAFEEADPLAIAQCTK